MSEPAATSEATATAPAGVIRMVKSYVARNGGSATALLQPIGSAGVRITLVAADGGILGDEVVADVDTANAVVDAVEGVTVSEEWTRELVSTANPRPGHIRKMAGWVAHSRHFPKARNAKIVQS
ncbi:hypothetical protein [Jongsikchunia kroppenstedtii]|uniref:hypothetical protein n=1 Tax=Jongsikchunia kroppenstedtii TaxID=1121721 RepID=UPI000475DAAA|nr:hypothetical protein [Jongsikchunia kroppenstedtii]